MLHHDNAPVHSSLLVRDFLTKNGHYSHSTTTLLARSSTCRLFSVPEAEINLEMTKICYHRGDKRKFTEGPEGDTETCVPGLPKMGRNVGCGVLVAGRSTLRVICVSNFQVKYMFYVESSRTF
jgi:hypothetical protein